MKYGLKQFRNDFPTDQKCLEYAFDTLHSKECGCGGVYKPVKGRNAYYCTRCRNQIHPLAETIFRRSLVPLSKWFNAIVLVGNGISIKALQKELGTTYKTAWRCRNILCQATQNGIIDLWKPKKKLIGKNGMPKTKNESKSITKNMKRSTENGSQRKEENAISVKELNVLKDIPKTGSRYVPVAVKLKSAFFLLTI